MTHYVLEIFMVKFANCPKSRQFFGRFLLSRILREQCPPPKSYTHVVTRS